ncbi:LLM class flavin-dependent oxidoreductase [Streptomyces sp. SCSIO 75703]|uniref:LLM class flavin-dependent oxidoreductase n=1 Tax=unclassified Streptomyces TaxID=2593676 RepID=UPI0006B410C3|nr:LLM class flavin-dependent oxidoreductase [Streptomyces sp. TP-A0875]
MARPVPTDTGRKTGTFSAACACACGSGLAVTRLPEHRPGSRDDGLPRTRTADEAGVDLMLPIARRPGRGGDTDFHGGVPEPITWAAGILAPTTRVSASATLHTAFGHPLVTASQAALARTAHGPAGVCEKKTIAAPTARLRTAAAAASRTAAALTAARTPNRKAG